MLYLACSTLLLLVGLFVIHWLHDQHHLDIVVRPAAVSATAPLISVCIPARNEERNIRACVEAVLGQTYPEFEVIVVDDRSSDATPAILASIRSDKLTVVQGSDLPPGWAGKPHALYQAAARARGEWLCFLDADTLLAPEALAGCFATAVQTRADLLTLMTFQVAVTFWERAVLPLVMTALSVGFSPRKVNDPARRDAIANGQFIFIRRGTYEAVGGHAAVRDRIVEDKAISEKVKWSGHRLVVADGMQLARTRMYTSLPELWEGWTKNIYLGLRDQVGLMVLGAFGALVSLVAALVLPAWPVLGLFWVLQGGGWLGIAVTLEAALLWLYVIGVRAAVAHSMRIPRAYALTTPLGAAVFAAMMFTSTWKVLSGQGVTWRGRTYKPGRP